jgi:hypothetical protein
MKGESVLYNDRLVPKEGFRTYIYSKDNQQKLVNSWNEFECEIQTGLWFAKKPPAIVENTSNEGQTKKRRGK